MPSDDETGFGGWPHLPRWVWVVAGVAAAAALVGLVIARTGLRRAAASSPTATTAPVSRSLTPATGSSGQWPSVAGACGSPAYLPQMHLSGQNARVHVTVLVGGTALREVTPSGGVSRPLPGLPDQGWVVTKLVAGPGGDYAFVDPQCSGYLWVYRIVADVAHRLNTTADDLLGGSRHAWAVTYWDSGVVLTPLNGGKPVTLKTGTSPAADTAAGLVVAYNPRPSGPGAVELLDPQTGGLLRRLAEGSPLGAADHVVLVRLPDCRAPLTQRRCTLESINLATGMPTARWELPPGRVPVSDAVFSPDGTLAAFQLGRARRHPRFATSTRFPPADVVVVHLRTRSLDLVPGLELPPYTQAGLAFDATGTWLLATVNQGYRGELLAWREGMTGPALVATFPGPLMAAPALLPMTPLRGDR